MNENKTTTTISTTEFPEEENVFKNVPKATEKYSDKAKDTTSNERLAKEYSKYFNLVTHSTKEEKERVENLRKMASMIINRSKRSSKDWKDLSICLMRDNIVLETIK